MLINVFKKSDLTVSTLNLGEKEWLALGIVTLEKVEYVYAYGNTTPTEPQPPAPANYLHLIPINSQVISQLKESIWTVENMSGLCLNSSKRRYMGQVI